MHACKETINNPDRPRWTPRQNAYCSAGTLPPRPPVRRSHPDRCKLNDAHADRHITRGSTPAGARVPASAAMHHRTARGRRHPHSRGTDRQSIVKSFPAYELPPSSPMEMRWDRPPGGGLQFHSTPIWVRWSRPASTTTTSTVHCLCHLVISHSQHYATRLIIDFLSANLLVQSQKKELLVQF